MAVIVAVYLNALSGPFQFDDYNVIVYSDTVHNLAAWYADLGHGLRPLLKLSYTLNWISGSGTHGFHGLNILLHVCNSLLVYVLVRQVCRTQANSAVVAGFTALLFALHPAQTEAVTYISGRSSSLMTFFYLAALSVYLKGRQENNTIWLYGYSPLLFLFAVASKETALTLPFALWLTEKCFYPATVWQQILRKQAAHWGVFFVLVLLLLVQPRYWQMLAFSADLHSLRVNFFTQLHALSYLLGQLLLPYPMNIDPDLPLKGTLLSVWQDALLWLAIFWFALWRWRGNPYLMFALGWLLLQLFLPYVFLPRLDVANDRQLYLAGWPVFLLLAVSLSGLVINQRLKLLIALIMWFGLAALTWQRNQDYRSEIALWESTVRHSPHKARPYNNLGYAYFLAGRHTEAALAYRNALTIDPEFWRAEKNLALLPGE